MKKHFFWTVLDQVLVSGGNFLTLFLGAIYLTSPDQGVLVILLSFYFFCLILSISLVYAPIQSLFARFNKSLNYIYSAFIYHLVVTIALTVIVFTAVKAMSSFGSIYIPNVTIYSFIAFILTQQIADFGRRVAYVTHSSFVAFTLSFCLYVPRITAFIILEPQNINELLLWLISTSVFDAVVVIFYIAFNKLKFTLHYAQQNILKHVAFSKNIFFSAPLGWFVAYSPTLVLGFVSGPVLVGILGTLRGIVGVANVFVEMIEVSVISQLTEKVNQGKYKYAQGFLFALLIVFSIGWLLMIALVINYYEFGVGYLGKEYVPFKMIFIVLCVVYLIYFYGRMHVLYFRILHNTKPELYNSIVSLISTVMLLPIIYIWDIAGAVIVFVSAQFIAFGMTLYKFKLER